MLTFAFGFTVYLMSRNSAKFSFPAVLFFFPMLLDVLIVWLICAGFGHLEF